jgi:hypothetical protein
VTSRGHAGPDEIARYAASRREQSRACTVNRELAFLKRVFNVAIASGLADRNR